MVELGHLIQTHGYWVLALGCMLEGESVLMLAAMAAHAGYLDPKKVVVIAAASAFVGDQLLFWLGRWYGPAALGRKPRIARQAERIRHLIERYHGWVVVGVRFAYGLRVAGTLLIGASGLRPWQLAVFNAVGTVLWAMLITALGWSLGQATQALFGHVWRLEAALVIAVLIAALGWGWTRHTHRRSTP